MLRQPIAALLRAAGGQTCCSNSRDREIAELEGARRLLDKELARAAAEGFDPPRH